MATHSDEKAVKDEKQLETVHMTDADSDVDLRDKDEALRLVGLERTAVFTDEYYAKVKRKLVSCVFIVSCNLRVTHVVGQDFVIPPLCAAVYCTQYL